MGDAGYRRLSALSGAVIAAALLLLGASAPAAAQSGSLARVYLTGDGLYQALNDPSTQTSTFPTAGRTGTFQAVYPAVNAPAFAGGLAIRLWRSLSAGAMVTRLQTRTSPTIDGEVPHPLIVDQPVPISGTARDLERDERAVHLQARVVIPVTNRLDLSVFGGPSRWQIRQDRIASLEYAPEDPIGSARLTGVVTSTREQLTWGYNAGIDASLYLTNHIGVGGLVLVATANPDEDPSATTADFRIGGLRAGGGLRLRF